MHITSFEEFKELAQRGTFVPVYKEIVADMLTPVSAFLKIAEHSDYAFLLESVEGGEQVARYSFLGKDPFLILRSRGGKTIVQRAGETTESETPFIATVRETVTGTNGVSIPAGSKATVQVVSVRKSENARDAASIVLNVLNVQVGGTTYPITGNIASAETVAGERSGKDAQKVAIGAAIGAGIGQVLGKDTKSTVIGAATGAAAGTAVAMGTANYEGCIPQGGRITLNLTSPATIGVGQ